MVREVIEDGRGMKHFDVANTLIEMYGAEMALNAILEIVAPKNMPVLDTLSKEPPVVVKLRKRNEFPKNRKFGLTSKVSHQSHDRKRSGRGTFEKKSNYSKRSTSSIKK